MGLTNDSILTFISNRLLKTIDKGLGSDRLDLSASELWEINHLFNLELVQSNLQREKPLHVGNLYFEFLIQFVYVLWMCLLQNHRVLIPDYCI